MTLAEQGYTVSCETKTLWEHAISYESTQWVARFQETVIGRGKTKSDATMICLTHADAQSQ